RLAHHPILVVAFAERGGAQPERAAFLVRVTAVDEALDDRLDPARGVQRALEVVVVELEVECLQVEVLLAPQESNGEGPDRLEIVDVARGRNRLAIGGLYRFTGQVGVGN